VLESKLEPEAYRDNSSELLLFSTFALPFRFGLAVLDPSCGKVPLLISLRAGRSSLVLLGDLRLGIFKTGKSQENPQLKIPLGFNSTKADWVLWRRLWRRVLCFIIGGWYPRVTVSNQSESTALTLGRRVGANHSPIHIGTW